MRKFKGKKKKKSFLQTKQDQHIFSISSIVTPPPQKKTDLLECLGRPHLDQRAPRIHTTVRFLTQGWELSVLVIKIVSAQLWTYNHCILILIKATLVAIGDQEAWKMADIALAEEQREE